ncbi:MAG: hypothetical protein CMQ40_12425 [Gammaproteobacteria bacterium]|nr:hypothetical protein [Gammaproteobacteria bacterium]
MNKQCCQAGFSLLEAIAALVILTSVVISVYAWIDNALFNSQRNDTRIEINKVVENFVADLGSRQLVTQKNGIYEYGKYLVNWKATLVDQSPGVSTNGVVSDFQVALFKVYFEIRHGDKLLASYTTREAAYRLRRVTQTGGPG